MTLYLIFVSRYDIQKPIAKVIGFEDSALDPVDWPIAPATGIKAMLSRFGLDPVKDISKWEINEAFAMVVLANARILGLSEDFQVKNTLYIPCESKQVLESPNVPYST